MAKWEKARCGAEVLDVNRAFDVAISAAEGFPLDIVNSERLALFLSNKINDMLIACVDERLSDYSRNEYREHIDGMIRHEEPVKLETMRNTLMTKVRAEAFKMV